MCSEGCGLICVVDKPWGKQLSVPGSDVCGLSNRNSSLSTFLPGRSGTEEYGDTLLYRCVPLLLGSMAADQLFRSDSQGPSQFPDRPRVRTSEFVLQPVDGA